MDGMSFFVLFLVSSSSCILLTPLFISSLGFSLCLVSLWRFGHGHMSHGVRRGRSAFGGNGAVVATWLRYRTGRSDLFSLCLSFFIISSLYL